MNWRGAHILKISIHLQPASKSLGGTEMLAVHIAKMLRPAHLVEIVHHREWLMESQLSAFGGVAEGTLTTRFVEARSNYLLSQSSDPRKIYQEPREWGRAVAGKCDVLLSLTHELPPFNPAPHGIALVLFPMSKPLDSWPLAVDVSSPHSVRRRLSRWLYRRQYAALWRGYDVKLAISDFSARWVKKRWAVDCDVVFPLVECDAAPAPKANRVLVLGRFSVGGVAKYQREMAAAFAEARGLTGWRLVCVGEARTETELQYVRDVQSAGQNAEIVLNASRDDVRRHLAGARVFWHAAGLLENEAKRPEGLEHFGIATVEAMAHGCVPVVIGRGGQSEIVENGVSGFLCHSLEEMVAHTIQLSQDPDLCQRMSEAARTRAQAFGPAAFAGRLKRAAPFLWS